MNPLHNDTEKNLQETVGDEIDARLINMIKAIPEWTPPEHLEHQILRRISMRKSSVWQRITGLFIQQRQVAFTYTPWKVALAAGVMLVICLAGLSVLNPSRNGFVTRNQAQTSGAVRLHFTFYQPGARHVALVGSFNGWQPGTTVMKAAGGGDGRWTAEIVVEPGRYEYVFLVDGKTPMPDPRSVFTCNDGFGAVNSIVFADDNTTIL